MAVMKFKQALETMLRLDPDVAIIVRGPHGIGKSALAKELAKRLSERDGIGYELIDRRLAQMTEGDMLGLPTIEDGTTRFNPPDFIAKACRQPCVLFLDEINRASREVQNVGMQLTLDRELSNGAKLHPQTVVISAVNEGALYQVTRMDPALRDRFFDVELLFDAEEWKDHARAIGVHRSFIDWISGDEKWLNPGQLADPNARHPSPRSATRCAVALKKILEEGDAKLLNRDWIAANTNGSGAINPGTDVYDKRAAGQIVAGFMGIEASVAFTEYLKAVETRSRIITGKDVYERWCDVRGSVDMTQPDVAYNVVNRFLDHCKSIPSVPDMTIPEGIGRNFTQLLKDVPKEQIVIIYQRLLEPGIERVDFLKAIHPYGVHLLLECFGTVPGEAGIGMLPTNPASRGDDAAENAA